MKLIVAKVATVAAGSVSGWDAAGAVGVVAGAVVAICALGVSISANNRAVRREREQELRDEYNRGRSDERDLWENRRRNEDDR